MNNKLHNYKTTSWYRNSTAAGTNYYRVKRIVLTINTDRAFIITFLQTRNLKSLQSRHVI